MDIKTILLKSLSLKKPMHGSRRIRCGKSYVIIKYVVIKNIFSIKRIKISRTHETWAQRIKYYKKDLRAYRKSKNDSFSWKSNLSNALYSKKLDKATLTELNNSSITKHTATTQTIDAQKHTKKIQTEIVKTPPKFKEIFKLGSATKSKPVPSQSVSLTTTAQQTIASARFCRSMSFNNKISLSSKGTSTISNVECKAIQCKRHTQTKASNTETNTKDSFAQVESDLVTNINSLPEELRKRFPLPAEEFGIFIYMLNEIGETVINQSQILNSNNEMIRHIIQTSMLQDSKRMNSSPCRSIASQTERLASIEKKNSFCQTNPEGLKQRKLLLFKGRSNRHKNAGKVLNEDKKPG